MRKSKLAIGLMSALLSVGALAACSDVTYSEDGVILTYTGADGTVINYTAADLFDDEFKDSSNYQKVFDAVYKIIIKNYFTETDPDESEYGSKQLPGLKTKAQVAVDGDKQTASKKAEANGTSYDTEFSAILKEKNCENETELFDYYLYKYEEETFNDNFEKVEKNMTILKNGTDGIKGYENNAFDGYFNEKVPYHVSHILVKIEDADSTNYANATVSEANAKKLFNVADALRQNTYNSFADTATLSDDSATRGDLGLVDLDKTATYIDEFKYALYAYENLYGKSTEAQNSKISIKKQGFDIVDQYNTVSHLNEDELSTEGFATIPYGAFEIMNSNAERTLGANDQKVNDGDVNFYPRNIFFNHYFNRHSLALVTPYGAKKTIPGDDSYIDDIDKTIVYPETLKFDDQTNKYLEGTGFHKFTKADDGVNFEGTYLATSIRLGDKVVYRPILVVRGGSSGDSGYQGIHFIVINRSPFEFINGDESDVSVASLSNYYTTYFPAQDKYPTYTVDGKSYKYQTYVNFSGNKDTYTTRAEEVLNAIKGFDEQGLKHFMFRKYFDAGKLAFNDSEAATKLAEGLAKWIKRSEQNKEYNAQVEWENKWISYIENLKQATNIQAKKTIAKACAIRFSNHADSAPASTPEEIAQYKIDHPEAEEWSDAVIDRLIRLSKPEYKDAWDEIGGVCNDGQRHF